MLILVYHDKDMRQRTLKITNERLAGIMAFACRHVPRINDHGPCPAAAECPFDMPCDNVLSADWQDILGPEE